MSVSVTRHCLFARALRAAFHPARALRAAFQVLSKMLAANFDRNAHGLFRQVLCLWLVVAMTSPLTLPQTAHAQSKAEKAKQRKLKAARARAAEQGPPKVATPATPAKGDVPAVNGPAAPIQPGTPDALPEIKPFETGLPYAETSPRSLVTFNLEDASLTDLVRLISQITGKRFILPGTTRSIKATVYAPTKVSAAEAYQAFISILELNGMALVPAGRYLKIVESGRVEGRPIPLFTQDESVPDGDRYITRLQRVNNIAAEDAASLIERFKSGDGAITAYAPTNMLIITDTGTNIRRMVRILDVIDVASSGEQIWVEPVHNATASDVADRLSEIFEPGGEQELLGEESTCAQAGQRCAGTVADDRFTQRRDADQDPGRRTHQLADHRRHRALVPAHSRDAQVPRRLDGRRRQDPCAPPAAQRCRGAVATTLQALISGRGGGRRQASARRPGGGGGRRRCLRGLGGDHRPQGAPTRW